MQEGKVKTMKKQNSSDTSWVPEEPIYVGRDIPPEPSNPLIVALAAFHLEVGVIEKSARAQFGEFADLSTVLSAVTPALSRHGLALVQTFDAEGDEDVLVTTLYHASGREISSRARLVKVEGAGGRQNPLHLWGGSVTYARRYTALALLGLAAGMDDDDGDIADPVGKAKSQPVKAPAKKPRKPKEVKPFASVADANDELGSCTTPLQLSVWVVRMKCSSLSDADMSGLRDSYAEHVALLKEKQEA